MIKETGSTTSTPVRVRACNAPAMSAYERCGFAIEGREREAALIDKFRHDDDITGPLDREFMAMRST